MFSTIFQSCKNLGKTTTLAAAMVLAAPSIASAGIVLDGQLNDWTSEDRIDVMSGLPVDGYQLYGRYEDNAYKFAVVSQNGTVDANTTIWLNTDQDTETGYQVFGNTVGAEFNVNIHTDNQPYLYTGAAAEVFQSGPLQHARSTDQSILEVSIPQHLLGATAGEIGSAINVVADVNNTDFLPQSYSDINQYTLWKDLPEKTQKGHRVAIVYSETTMQRFWGQKSYSQLFMSVQTQTMMAGIPFDLISETDLLDVNKIINYDTLIFPLMSSVPDEHYNQIKANLALASKRYNVGIVAAGNLMTNKANGDSVEGDAYATMKHLVGVTRIDGAGPVDIEVRSSTSSHPILKDYDADELIQQYVQNFTDYFVPVSDDNAAILAKQTINETETHNSAIAVQMEARNVHFSTVQQMADANMLWSAIRWSSMGDQPVVGLKLGREKSIFVGRNDMDQSMFIDEIDTVEVPLLELLKQWKQKYDFVGSYYINVGNKPEEGEVTDWSISKPLYDKYMALGNEMGTHSYTHPHDTNILSDEELKFQFADSRQVIEENLGLSNLGAAVPGAPEDLRTAQEIIQHVDYLSGGYSGVGAGFVNAMGFLTPDSEKVYLSPNVTFDFTNIQFLKHTAEETIEIWSNELDELALHANQPIIHWPWHDYGPTISVETDGYTVEMFESVISKAKRELGAEFVTGKDLADRMVNFRKTSMDVEQNGDQVKVSLSGGEFGKQGIKLESGLNVASVNNWYAYNEDTVFTAKDTSEYTINLGETAQRKTHINYLPSRSELLSVKGNGTNLRFSFTGEGAVQIKLGQKCDGVRPFVRGTKQVQRNKDTLVLKFSRNKTHNVHVSCRRNRF